MKLPNIIQQFIGNSVLEPNKIGQSPSDVYSFNRNNETFFLKRSSTLYTETTYSVSREAKMLSWLSEKLKVPELIMTFQDEQFEFMITKAINAKPISALFLTDQELLAIYKEALNLLNSIAIIDCPFISNIDHRLKESKFFIDNQLLDDIDQDDFDTELWGDHKTYLSLWNELTETRVEERLVFSHGDITDSNIFIDKFNEIYFLDLGRAGLADEFVDISFVERCLREDASEETAKIFLKHLKNDRPDKRNYFLKLDELN
ncbi:APH(3')-VI family aminoglycoside O-phosphotransferase [Acinetobacter baumannii]|uniref:APH(3')-VI family aminoglycoside O-phosphotransferase n=1 Tax=Acinetobacter baumannii TaxID=470 RepID=UPI0005F96699|nr:APH(3')-VI family aminoglycoside O-phosphotransferase [Acinetobacter baumannii]KJX71323.1 aminoglycoside phosphotransferase [Acinetobacter baumannii]MBF6757165.1 APH(3')-VI family aminoglycoside O-phosphotransferase [Acinetobacter baumannii]MBF6956828.1 APH(3')-VI family aminoglycoside O-phosphotransferase [Acinetobacter baumannii]MCO9033287.1 APH(3')-VI family aminoglycoside O-phosphotransferase [Acinetobacter baumannii]MCO9037008.1 APH(3')-VI family aminoglycoside O-phosphotransferase [Ac